MPTTVLYSLGYEGASMTVMIGVDPHKGSHTAVAVDKEERALAELRVRSGPKQLERLLQWAEQFPDRTWAVENATGLGFQLAQQLVAGGERVLDVQPKLAAGCGCWPPSRPTRTTRMTFGRWPSPRSDRRRPNRSVSRITRRS
jgi:hypothetical protein